MLLTFKRCLSAFLGAVLIVTLVPAAAAAEEETAGEFTLLPANAEIVTLPETFEISEKNPLYEGIISEEYLFESIPPTLFGSTEVNGMPFYHTVEDVGEILRENMKEHQASITLGYRMSVLDNDTFNTACHDILNYALAHTGTSNEGDSLRWNYGIFSAEIPNSNVYIYENDYCVPINFKFTYYTTAEQEAEVDTAVDALLSELALDGKSDFEIVQSVYDWICENVRYDYDNLPDDSYVLKHTAYAALIDKTAVCQGYALLMYRLLLENGIDCRLIAGLGNGGNHGWNIVKLGNVYYNADSTWDEGKKSENYQWFLLNEESFVNHVRDIKLNEYGTYESYGLYDTEEFHAAYPMAAENYITHEPDEILTEGTLDEENGITWRFTYDGTLTISGEGAMPGFAQTTDDGMTMSTEFLPWDSLRSKIVKIVVEPGITSIGNGAFFECTEAVSAEIADTVKKIGMWAFTDCTSLEEISLNGKTPPETENECFSNTLDLKTIYVPAASYDDYVAAFSAVVDTDLITFLKNYSTDTAMYVYNDSDGEYHDLSHNLLDRDAAAIWLNETTAAGYQDPVYTDTEGAIPFAEMDHGWYEVVLCGLGSYAESFPEDMEGKIAFCIRGDSPFAIKGENALNAGAAACLIGNNCRKAEALDENGNVTGQYENTSMAISSYLLPMASLSSDITVRLVAAAADCSVAEAVAAVEEIYWGSTELSVSHKQSVRIFIGTEEEYQRALEEERKDVNGDGSAASDDALYLLRYTILPDRYPLAVDDADFDDDGYVTAKDAVFLLNALGSTVTP